MAWVGALKRPVARREGGAEAAGVNGGAARGAGAEGTEVYRSGARRAGVEGTEVYGVWARGPGSGGWDLVWILGFAGTGVGEDAAGGLGGWR